jgi:hypothetical protein
MKALILYVLFVVGGAVLAGFLGLWVENNFGSAISLIVFLSLFFANFVFGWLMTMLVMDGTLRAQPAVAATKA